MKVLMINGPNMNLLGAREKGIYGTVSLSEIEQAAREKAGALGLELTAFQSNHEGAIIDKIHSARGSGVSCIIINPGGYTHTSVAIRDALLAVDIPFIEVHISNVTAREPFRQTNLFSDVAMGTINGFGALGYTLALEAVHGLLGSKAR